MPPPPAEGRVPRLVPAPCLRRTCDMCATKGRRQGPHPPPPHTPPPPQGWGMKEGRGGQRPPLPRTKRQDGEAAGRGCGADHTTVPEGSTRRASPSGGGTGGANAQWEGRRRGPRGMPHSPAEGQVPRHVPAPCLRRAYAGGRTARAPPPPTPLLPHPPRKGARTARGWRGDIGGGTEDRQTCQGKGSAKSGEKKKKQPRTKHTNAPEEESEKTETKNAANGGRPG